MASPAPSPSRTEVPVDFTHLAPSGPTNAQATAVAVGAVSQMDQVDGAFYSTGPAFWSYSFSQDDVCRPVTAVHGKRNIRSSGLVPGALSSSSVLSPSASALQSPSASAEGMRFDNSDPNGPSASSESMLSQFKDYDTGDLVPPVDVYGAPDFNAMIAASMYDSIKANYDYILQTQYGVGADGHGHVWKGMTTAPIIKPKLDKDQLNYHFSKEHNKANSLTTTPTTATPRTPRDLAALSTSSTAAASPPSSPPLSPMSSPSTPPSYSYGSSGSSKAGPRRSVTFSEINNSPDSYIISEKITSRSGIIKDDSDDYDTGVLPAILRETSEMADEAANFFLSFFDAKKQDDYVTGYFPTHPPTKRSTSRCMC